MPYVIARIEAQAAERHEAMLRERGWQDEYECETNSAMNYGDGQAAERSRLRDMEPDERLAALYVESIQKLDRTV